MQCLSISLKGFEEGIMELVVNRFGYLHDCNGGLSEQVKEGLGYIAAHSKDGWTKNWFQNHVVYCFTTEKSLEMEIDSNFVQKSISVCRGYLFTIPYVWSTFKKLNKIANCLFARELGVLFPSLLDLLLVHKIGFLVLTGEINR